MELDLHHNWVMFLRLLPYRRLRRTVEMIKRLREAGWDV